MRIGGNAFDKEDSCSALFALFAVGDVGGCIYLAFLFTIFATMAELWAGGAILFLQKAFHRDLTQLNPAFQKNLKKFENITSGTRATKQSILYFKISLLQLGQKQNKDANKR